MCSISCTFVFSISINIFILNLPTCGAQKLSKISQIDINSNVTCSVNISDGVEYLVTCTDNSPNLNENKIKCCAITESMSGLSYEWGTCHLRNDYGEEIKRCSNMSTTGGLFRSSILTRT